MRFEVFTKEVEINGEKYELRPLTGRHLPKLYAIGSKLGKFDEDSKDSEFLEALDEDTVNKMYELALESFKKSYPADNEQQIEQWVGQNLMGILPALIEVNMNVPDDVENQ